MPFDKTRVHPVVADLLKVRAWVAEHVPVGHAGLQMEEGL